MREAAYADRVAREASALRVLAASGLPAPRVHEILTIDGRPGLVVDRLPGESLLDQLGRNPLRLEHVARSMARAHAAMHEIVAPAQLPDLKEILRERIEQAEALPAELRPRVLAVLSSLPNGDRLCHGTCTRATCSAASPHRWSSIGATPPEVTPWVTWSALPS